VINWVSKGGALKTVASFRLTIVLRLLRGQLLRRQAKINNWICGRYQLYHAHTQKALGKNTLKR